MLKSRFGAAVATSVVATMLPKSAGADPFGSATEDTGARADSFVHTYCQGSIAPDLWDNAINGMNSIAASTDLTASQLGCANDIDVRFDNGDGLAAGVRGSSQCIVWVTSPTICDSNRIRISEANAAVGLGAGTEENNRDKTIRHEIGHSVGLTHYKDVNGDFPNPPDGQHDCMISGPVDNQAVWINYSGHHKDHINAAY